MDSLVENIMPKPVCGDHDMIEEIRHRIQQLSEGGFVVILKRCHQEMGVVEFWRDLEGLILRRSKLVLVVHFMLT
jgi:hypothetical protein